MLLLICIFVKNKTVLYSLSFDFSCWAIQKIILPPPIFTSKLKGLKRRRRPRQGFQLPAFESTQLRKLEDGLVGEEECEALLHLAQASGTMGWTPFLESLNLSQVEKIKCRWWRTVATGTWTPRWTRDPRTRTPPQSCSAEWQLASSRSSSSTASLTSPPSSCFSMLARRSGFAPR